MEVCNEKFAYLVKISPNANNNRYYRMIGNGDVFVIEMGRVGATPVTSRRPISLWNTTLQRKLAEGYQDRSDLCRIATEKKPKYQKIKDKKVRRLIETLQKYADVVLDETYNISYEDVTPAMIDEAQELIHNISVHQDDLEECLEMFNKLFVVIPRKMKNVQDMLPDGVSDIPDALVREQDFLDVMSAKVSQSKTESRRSTANQETILDALGLDVRLCSEQENRQIRKHLSKESAHHFKRAFRVINQKTEKRFWSYMEQRELTDENIHYLYHGSKNANYYGLMSEGPKLNPKAPVTGKMFGYGIYFATRAKKSINYTDLRGSYWNHGNSRQAFLAVYKVAYGNQKDVDAWTREMSNYTKKSIYPHDAVFAHKGISLLNDEIIIYDESQMTIQYLIELEYQENKDE